MSAGLNVSPAQVSRSYHDLSYSKTFDCDVGKIIPVMADEAVPGDVFSIGVEMVVRANPLMTPLLHRVDIKVDYFFVPYRILMGRVIDHPEEGEWSDFITGGKDGKAVVILPRWSQPNTTPDFPVNGTYAMYTLWDYFGFPVFAPGDPLPLRMPLDFPRRAYNLIFNEYYRDQDLVDELDITENYKVLNSAWEKDYFTSARPWQQKGDPLAFPINLQGNAVFSELNMVPAGQSVSGKLALGNGAYNDYIAGAATVNDSIADAAANTELARGLTRANSLNISNSSTFDVADLRFIVQAQRWMERNARAGNRYTEFLKAHFGVYPNDARLQRPEYIGGSRAPMIFSEVLQTSETTGNSPQGNMSGHGLTFDNERIGKYRVEEFGVIIGLMRIMPKPAYFQGINRQWLRSNRFDFYMPEFAHLSEQEVFNEELYATGTGSDLEVFGFQGRYNEMRFKQNQISGAMRDSLKFWNMARIFGSKPVLNDEFITVADNFRKDIFQVPSEKGFIVSFGNRLDVMRPIPVDPEPGLMDHI